MQHRLLNLNDLTLLERDANQLLNNLAAQGADPHQLQTVAAKLKEAHQELRSLCQHGRARTP
ncbi:hypothetical protein MM188_003208 [Vibrio cholerae]|nr:hypothetical protein [Vibrio cholerae]